jgi:murein DD-endopeptidase MepM/ murein hydrolase activator NlpD
VVKAAVDGLPDLVPPETDREAPAGNHVIVTCQGVDVLLAHLQRGSVLVRADAVVTVGQPLGRVGNSGNTSEPHLHIHAVQSGSQNVLDGVGVPLLFDRRFPVRNTLLVR